MNRNWYALLLLVLLVIGLYSAGRYMDISLQTIDQGLEQAYACAEEGDYLTARQAFQAVSQKAEDYSPIWMLLVRRNLVDQLNQTLATIPAYATQENHSDLSVETLRARAQTAQIRQSFFSWF